ncbi:MAG: hypothetical protein WC529_00490 [Candidatus Margulisiibacteriota bacterium]
MSAIRPTITLPLFHLASVAVAPTRYRQGYYRLPPEIAALRQPKNQVANLSPVLRSAFEQGGSVNKDFPLPGRYFFIRLPSGAMTIDGTPCDRALYEIYREWRAAEGLGDLAKEETMRHMRSVGDRLKSLGIVLENQFGAGYCDPLTGLVQNGEAWRIIDEVLNILPDKLLRNEDLHELKIGTGRVGAALASAYDNHAVYLYAGALQGSRRELIAKIIHEIGHSTENSLDPLTLVRLASAHRRIKHDLIGLDIMGGPEYRREYQLFFNEFLAEMHLLYVCAGPQLRAKIDACALGSRERKAWDYIYSVFRDEIFDGREYD